MGEFFKPLRRKVGVVTLLIACIITARWVAVLAMVLEDGSVGSVFTAFSISAEGTGVRVEWQGYSSTFHSTLSAQFKGLIPYWSLVIPLTLLSAWLLLSKTRTSRPIHVEDSQQNH